MNVTLDSYVNEKYFEAKNICGIVKKVGKNEF